LVRAFIKSPLNLSQPQAAPRRKGFPPKNTLTESLKLYTLPETNKTPEKWWLGDNPFLYGTKGLVSGAECQFQGG